MSENRLSPSDMATLKQLLEDECDYKLPENVMEEFLSLGRVITYGKWDNVILEGDINPDIYIAMEGIVRCFYWDGDKEKTAFFSTLPTLFMSYHPYFANAPSFYTFQTCTRAKILHIRKADFDNLLKRSHLFAMWNLRLCQTQFYYFELKRKLYTGTAKDRYLSLVRTLPHIMKEVPLSIVASYLGVTPQYLSVLRKELVS